MHVCHVGPRSLISHGCYAWGAMPGAAPWVGVICAVCGCGE